MPVYLWEGKNRKNETRKGEMEASSEEVLRSNLTRMRIIPTKVKKKPKDLLEGIAFFQPKVQENDVIIFARQFSTMIDAGLPIIQCLEILLTQQENPTFKKAIKMIKGDVEGGQTFATALKKHPKLFDSLFVNMVAAGEAGGILDIILRRLSNYMEKMMKLKRQVKGAMTYPLVTLVIAFVVVVVILVFVIPTFTSMFEGFGATLPLPTQFVIDMSDFVRNNILVLMGGMIIAAIAYKQFGKTVKGRKSLDRFYLKLPVFGILIRKVAVSKFTRTMGTMLNSGVAILDALDIVAKTAGNVVIEESIYEVRAGISEGRTMADPLIESGIFPSMVCSMIAVGESTGALDTMLEKIADFYDDEVDQAVENLTALIEPFMLVFLGTVIGGLVISMYLPIFKMASVVG